MNTAKLIGVVSIIGVILIIAIACTASPADVSNPALEDAAWVLKSYGDPDNLIAAVPDKDITLSFNKDKHEINGHGGINYYGGTYELNGNRITVSNLVMTLMAGPELLMGQETQFMKILQSAENYGIEGQSLTITGTEGVLVFAR